jgi:hypothetical protein
VCYRAFKKTEAGLMALDDLDCHRFSQMRHRSQIIQIQFAISASLCQSVAGKLFR